MKYGFVIDNRKCIGCHACTVACNIEHEIPEGVNRTLVNQVKHGIDQEQDRFSILRCNQCEDAPCITICPTNSLQKNEYGIVDFNSNLCFGCKACMQACPYDSLFINPETKSAEKCNFCVHKLDQELAPACVTICPETAIVHGDLDDEKSEINFLLHTHHTEVLRPEKNAKPNLFYINGVKKDTPAYSFQKYLEEEKYLRQHVDLQRMLDNKTHQKIAQNAQELGYNSSEFMQKVTNELSVTDARRMYALNNKTLWGTSFTLLILSKAIATGAFLLIFLVYFVNHASKYPAFSIRAVNIYTSIYISAIFLGITFILLLLNLEKPQKFYLLFLKPNFKSWITKGAFSLVLFALCLVLFDIGIMNNWRPLVFMALYCAAIFAVISSIYVAFLFAQAKARDFWQNSIISFRSLIHSFMCGASAYLITSVFVDLGLGFMGLNNIILLSAIFANVLTLFLEVSTNQPTADSHKVAQMITKGTYKSYFLLGGILLGNLVPFLMLLLFDLQAMHALAGFMVLFGVYVTNSIYLDAPQKVGFNH